MEGSRRPLSVASGVPPSLGSGILFRKSLQSRETTDAERQKGVSGSDEANETRFTSTGREERSIKERERGGETIEEETRRVEERREAPSNVVYVTTRTAFLSRETKVRTQVVVMGRREKAETRGTVAKSRRRTSNKIHLRVSFRRAKPRTFPFASEIGTSVETTFQIHGGVASAGGRATAGFFLRFSRNSLDKTSDTLRPATSHDRAQKVTATECY